MTSVKIAAPFKPVVAGEAGKHGGKDGSDDSSRTGFDKALATASTKTARGSVRSNTGVTALHELIHAIKAEDFTGDSIDPSHDVVPAEEDQIIPLVTPEAHMPEIPIVEAGDYPSNALETSDSSLTTMASVPDPSPITRTSGLFHGAATSSTEARNEASGLTISDATGRASILATNMSGQAQASATGAQGAGAANLTETQGEALAKPAPATAKHALRAQAPGLKMHADGQRMTMASASDLAQNRVNVVGFSTSPAPVQPGITASSLVAAIEAEPSWRAAADAIANTGQRGHNPHHSVSTLRIQLNPAELGMVTARLVASGAQLQVEIQVESNDARQRLHNDSELIIKALRTVGYDVDRLTIQHAPQSGGQAQQQIGAGRDAPMQEHAEQQANANAGGRHGQDDASDDQQSANQAGMVAQQHPGSDVYI